MQLSDKSGLVRKLLIYTALLAIPSFLIFSSLNRIEQREDIWYGGGYDPSYAYLYNSLNMATFRLSGHIDHPGTPMQVIGGVVLRIAYTINPFGGDSITDAVISQPEFYLNILNKSVAWMSVITLIVLGLFIFRFTKNIWYAILIQTTPLFSEILLYNGFLRISQEVVLMIGSITFGAFCLFWLFRQGQKPPKFFSDGFGIITGFGLASKIIFLPLMLIPMIISGGKKNRIRYLKASILSFIFFTIPIIPAYHSMVWWIVRLFSHSGIYGSGDTTIINTTTYFADLKSMIIGEPLLLITFLLTFIFLMVLLIGKITVKYKVRALSHVDSNKSFLLLLAIFITQAIGFIVTAKHPKTSYLMPYLCLSSVSIIVMLHVFSRLFKKELVRHSITAIIVVTISAISFIRTKPPLKTMFTNNNNQVFETAWQVAREFDNSSFNDSRHAVIGINPGPSPIAAHFFANAYSRMRYADQLTTYYPHYYIFDTYSERLVNWYNKPVTWTYLTIKYGSNISIIGDYGMSDYISKSIKSETKSTAKNIASPLELEELWSHQHLVAVWRVKPTSLN